MNKNLPTKKYCAVPMCKNTIISAPEKLFICVPSGRAQRKKWFAAMRRDMVRSPISDLTSIFVCEDHFDIENDIENIRYVRFCLENKLKCTIKLREGLVPHKFDCQATSRNLSASHRKSIVIDKINRKRIIADLLEPSTSPRTEIPELPVEPDLDQSAQSIPLRSSLFCDKAVQARPHFNEPEDFEIHVKEETENFKISNDETYDCVICWSRFSADNRLKTHIASHEEKFSSVLGKQVNQQKISIKEEELEDEIEIKEEPIDRSFEGIREPEVLEIHFKEEPGNVKISNDESCDCVVCWSRFSAENRLKTHIPSHEEKLSSILGEQVNEQIKEEEHYEDVEVDEIEIKEEPIDRPFECVREPEDFEIHVKEEPGKLKISNDETCDCVVCWSGFSAENRLKTHIPSHEEKLSSILGEQVNEQIKEEEHYEDVEVDEIEIKEEPIDRPFECVREPEDFEIHVKEEPGKLKISNDETCDCVVCWSGFSAENRLKTHIPSHEEKLSSILGEQVNEQIKEEEHYEDVEVDEIEIKEEPIDRPFECVREPEDFEIHVKEEPGKLKISNDETCDCVVCWSRFSAENRLKTHIPSNEGKQLRSKICKNDFTRRILKRHIEIECEVCKKVVASVSALKVHMRNHTGEKPYKCDICKKKFAQGGSLNKHMRIHTGEKPHECHVCQKKFAEIGVLNRHMRIHTGEKPHECHVCKKKFNEGLKRHMKIHTGEKPHECIVCKMKFSLGGNLKRHMLRTHTGETLYDCYTCKKRFTERNKLKRHIMSIHM